jgi:mono/diheme cytochrome c family protein
LTLFVSRVLNATRIVNLITKLREDGMRARLRSLTVAAVAVTLVAGAALTSAWAQGEWKAPADAKATKNPVKGVGNAKKNVETNCVTCHGASGKGDGPAAAALPPPKPADWTSAKIQAESDGELFWKISNGRGAMPPWKHLPEKDRWEIVNYIRTLKK